MTQPAFPQPNGEFEWVQAPWGPALQCRPLAAIATHYFTTRELGLEGVRDDDPGGWKALGRALGVETDALVRMRQVHGADVFVAKRAPVSASHDAWPEADIAVSNDPSLAVSVRVADCVPILLADARTGAVAAVHAGWKGTAAGAVMAAVNALASRFGANPSHMVAAVGP